MPSGSQYGKINEVCIQMQKWICNVRNRENALTYEEDAKKCLTAGMNAHLAEPLQMEKAIAAIAEHCKK